MKVLILALAVLFFLLQYRLWLGDGNLIELRRYKQKIEGLNEEIARVDARNRTLQAEIEDLRKGKDAIEERAREELGMVKKGEIFFHVIEGERH